jgi:hypothetical protein
MEKRFTALRIIATLYKIAGVIIAIFVLLGVVFTVISPPAIDLGNGFSFSRQTGGLGILFAIFAAIIELLVGGLSALGVYAVGELLYLAIHVEENTRFTALIIRDRMPAVPVQSVAPTMPPPASQPIQPPNVPPPYQTPPPYEPPPAS